MQVELQPSLKHTHTRNSHKGQSRGEAKAVSSGAVFVLSNEVWGFEVTAVLTANCQWPMLLYYALVFGARRYAPCAGGGEISWVGYD